MRPSIKHHIFQQFFLLSLLTIISLVGLVELLSDDLEDNMVSLEIASEKTHYLSMINGTPQTWVTATSLVAFMPDNISDTSELPELFQGLPSPFLGEIETVNEDYWVSVDPAPGGILYVAKETSLFDQRQDVFLFGIMIVAALFIIISFILTQLSARRIVKPLIELTQEISNINPQYRSMRVSENYHDQELYSIATTFNSYLNTMEAYVKREHMLIGMASHELRTPIAVTSGALDVLKERGTLGYKDTITIERIREATDEMNANISAILMLARKQPAAPLYGQILLSQSLQSVVQARLNTHPEEQSRLSITPSEIDHQLVSDTALVNMLLRNLIQNSLEHTQGHVTLRQNKQGLLVSDEGDGLPRNVRQQLEQKQTCPSGATNESGIGLFIVTLICERLGWRIEAGTEAGAGTHLQLYFPK